MNETRRPMNERKSSVCHRGEMIEKILKTFSEVISHEMVLFPVVSTKTILSWKQKVEQHTVDFKFHSFTFESPFRVR